MDYRKMKVVVFIVLFGTLEALRCSKDYKLIDNLYERGYDITCEGLTNNVTHLLRDLKVTNEISLRMENCSLTKVTSALFGNVKQIKHLYLDNSTFTYVNSEPIFHLLEMLQDLRIINTKFKVTNYTLSNLTNLKELTLINNGLKIVEHGSFKDLSNLLNLHISENHITDLTNVPLCDLKNLMILNISNNNIEELGDVFYCENVQTSINININDKVIKSDIHPHRPTPFSSDLYEIDLSYNNIEELTTSFSFLRSLKTIKLQGNKLNRLNSSSFTFLYYLENFRADNNSIQVIDDNVFKGKRYIEEVDLSHNDITFLNLTYLNTVKYLNLAHNRLNIDSVLTINDNNTLETFILDNNGIEEIKPNTFKKYSRLKYIHLANNKLVLLSSSLSGLINLKELYLCNNNIQGLPKEVFKDTYNLTILDLSKNNLTNLEFNDIFVNLKQLEILNMSSNALISFNSSLVDPLQDLKVLDLSYNKLHNIDYDKILSKLTLLNSLDIKFNHLTCEMLSKMIKFLQKKNVNYNIQEVIDTDKVNVGGIYCYKSINKTNNAVNQEIPQKSIMFNLTLGLIIILLLVVLVVIIFKIHVFLKRRKYRADEFELIDE